MARHTFFCIDGDTCGNPVRIVTGGSIPQLRGETMFERQRILALAQICEDVHAAQHHRLRVLRGDEEHHVGDVVGLAQVPRQARSRRSSRRCSRRRATGCAASFMTGAILDVSGGFVLA